MNASGMVALTFPKLVSSWPKCRWECPPIRTTEIKATHSTALCILSNYYYTSTPIKGQGTQKLKKNSWSQLYQFFIFKLQVILCCCFCHWFLNDVSPDEPDGQTAMNIPISGTYTLIPLPASAPFKLWKEKKGEEI